LKFEYYSSPLTKHQIIYNNANSLTASPFKQAARTIIIVDGFLSDGTSPMSQSTKDVYLRLNTNQNVIVLDWGKLSGSTELPLSNIISTGLTYTAALGNVGAVGERLADFCNFLRTTRGVEFSNIQSLVTVLEPTMLELLGISSSRSTTVSLAALLDWTLLAPCLIRNRTRTNVWTKPMLDLWTFTIQTGEPSGTLLTEPEISMCT